MLVIFDLDYTLLRTQEFKQGLAAALQLDEQHFQQDCRYYFQNRHYSLETHLQHRLQKCDTRTKQQINVALEQLWQRINAYLDPYTMPLLQKLIDRQLHPVLLTHGDPVFQKKKVNTLSIKASFDSIVYAEKDKIGYLSRFQQQTTTIIINDDARESLLMRSNFDNAVIRLIQGPYCRNTDHCLKVYQLQELYEGPYAL